MQIFPFIKKTACAAQTVGPSGTNEEATLTHRQPSTQDINAQAVGTGSAKVYQWHPNPQANPCQSEENKMQEDELMGLPVPQDDESLEYLQQQYELELWTEECRQ